MIVCPANDQATHGNNFGQFRILIICLCVFFSIFTDARAVGSQHFDSNAPILIKEEPDDCGVRSIHEVPSVSDLSDPENSLGKCPPHFSAQFIILCADNRHTFCSMNYLHLRSSLFNVKTKRNGRATIYKY